MGDGARILLVVVSLLINATPQLVSAQESDARALFEQGQEAARSERWSEALELYRRAYRIEDRPFILRNIGVCLRVLGRHVESMVVYQRLLRETDDPGEREEIRGWIEEARRSIGTLSLRVEPADARISIDGEPVSGQGSLRRIPLDPGDHNVLVTADGYSSSRHPVSLLPGQELSREVRLVVSTSAAAPPDSGAPVEESPVFWTLLGVGVVGVVAVVLGALLYDPGVEPVEPGTLGSVTTLIGRW